MANNLIITGLPRSGTSFLCAQLNSFKNTVIINEPPEAPLAFRKTSDFTIKDVYENFRTRILSGEKIPNKTLNGKYIEDTHGNDQRELFQPDFDNSEFILGLKNTMVFASNIDRIIKLLPGSIIIACVRHPYDIAGSWRRVSFPHVSSGKPHFLLDLVNDKTRRELQKIISEDEQITRYAKLWTLFVSLMSKHHQYVKLIRYEDLIQTPSRVLPPLGKTLNREIPNSIINIPGAKIRKRDGELTKHERNIIARYCAKHAQTLGYKL